MVLVVFDEFGGDILLGPDGRIDAGRFPHFAALARDGTWFRNAQTRYDSTTKAVPLILDGIAPRPKTAPTVRDHPHSIFTALGRARLPDRAVRGGHGDVPGALLPLRAGAGSPRSSRT